MKKLILLPLLLLLFQNMNSQIDSLFPLIDRSYLPEARFRTPQVYTGETLSTYMYDDAALFREYGCMDAWISELSLGKGKYRLEIFRMFGPEEAFGIFSVLKKNCLDCSGFPPYSCRAENSMLTSRGRYLVNVAIEKSTPSDSMAFMRITEAVLCRIAEPSSGLADYFPGIETADGCSGIMLVKGKEGLVKTGEETEKYLKGSEFETAVVFPRDSLTEISLKFRDGEGIMKFASLRNWRTKSADQYGNLMESGEIVKVLSENQLIITLRK